MDELNSETRTFMFALGGRQARVGSKSVGEGIHIFVIHGVERPLPPVGHRRGEITSPLRGEGTMAHTLGQSPGGTPSP